MNGFLFDENLPRHLTFVPSLPVVTSSVLGPQSSDAQLWEYARVGLLVIVTKDADFSNRMVRSTTPPWVVHLRFGNLKRAEYHRLLSRSWKQVEALLPAHKLVCVYRDRVEAFRD